MSLRRFGMHKCQGHMVEFLLTYLVFSPSVAIVVSCPLQIKEKMQTIEGVIPDGFIDSFAFKRACINMRRAADFRVTLANDDAVFIFQVPRYSVASSVGKILTSLSAISSLSNDDMSELFSAMYPSRLEKGCGGKEEDRGFFKLPGFTLHLGATD